MATTRDHRPMYLKIAARIRAEVMSGDFPRGSQLPPTHWLAERYGADDTTVQQALSQLKDEGFLVGRWGKPVYVTDRSPLVISGGASFKEDPRDVVYRLRTVAEVHPPADVANLLRIDESETTVLRERVGFRVKLYESYPFEVSRSYYPSSIAAGTALAGQKEIKGSVPAVLAELGYSQRDDFIDRVSARMPTTEELEALELPGEVPVLRQLRVIFSDNERPIEVIEMIKVGHLSETEYRQAVG